MYSIKALVDFHFNVESDEAIGSLVLWEVSLVLKIYITQLLYNECRLQKYVWYLGSKM